MNHRKIVQQYYGDINNLSELLAKLVNSYRLLIGGAGELNTIALAKKNDVKHALERANELGKVIDEIIEVLEETSCGYMDYCRIKSELVGYKFEAKYIQTEIDEELKLKE